MSYHANISMVKYLVSEIMPRVWVNRPQVKLVIVGKDPTPEIRALGEDSRITVTGTVDDIRPYLWKATAAVVPLVYGAGIQNKILEAMACETPVITTSKTLSSLHVISGDDILVADSADEFSQAITGILDSKTLQSKVGGNGGKYVRKHHSWNAIAKQMLACYTLPIRQS
ncbi:MAG: glycosyltransferase [Anaerolineales bacterium]|nr:glycosyltransferase [Anaerolineales bacterium]